IYTVTRVYKAIIKTIREVIKSGRRITISGIGTFKVKIRKARKTKNIKTGTIQNIPEGKKISFKPSLSFKKLIKS
ncbi:MAG: HU family DNA-binding protein, partial [bacterium]|nr:HU family DNA-binding protein [bacterium]